MVRVYGGKDRRVCRKVFRWLEERGVSYRFFDIGASPVDTAIVNHWITLFGMERLVDRRTVAWRGQDSVLNGSQAADTVSWLLSRPQMLKAPIIGAGDIWLLGWNAENKIRLLGKIGNSSAHLSTNLEQFPSGLKKMTAS